MFNILWPFAGKTSYILNIPQNQINRHANDIWWGWLKTYRYIQYVTSVTFLNFVRKYGNIGLLKLKPVGKCYIYLISPE